jgi:membrane protease YdiL (CAAX protease family)
MAIGVVIGGTIVVGVPAATAAVLIAGDADIAENDTALAVLLGANAVLEMFLLAAVAMFAVRKYKVSWAMVGLRRPRRGSWWLPLVLVSGALVLVWTYFTILFALGIEPESNIPNEAFDSIPLVAIVAVLSLAIAPVMEETFFRGFLFSGLRGRWGVFLAALASGFLFALAHIDPLVYVPFTAVGMLFAWGYVYSGSIVSSMIAHLLFNGISFSLAISGVAN